MVEYTSLAKKAAIEYPLNSLEKFFEEISKKVLTKGIECDIIVKLSARRIAKVIEN